MYVCTYIITINERWDHKFKGKEGTVYERVWSEEREGEDVVITW